MANRKEKQETPQEKAYRELVESIAGNIQKLAQAVTALLNGPLKRDALIVLLARSSGQTQESVREILKALETMEKDWLNKK